MQFMPLIVNGRLTSFLLLENPKATIDLLFRRVEPCTDEFLAANGFASCQDYWDSIADSMQERSFEVAGFWVIVAVVCVLGNVL